MRILAFPLSWFIRFSALAGLALLFSGCKKPVAAAPETFLVRTALVESMDNIRPESEAGYLAIVRADNETDLSFKVGGIAELIGPGPGKDWDEGTAVKAGTTLAELKQSDFTNALISARAHADLTGKVFERFSRLRATEAISQQELDVTQANWLTAKAQLDQAEQNLRDSRLVAPIDGVVLARYVNSRVTVGAGQRVLRFADTSIMSVELGLPDRLVGRLAPGNDVDVEVSALEGRPPFRGHVSEVGVAASPEARLFRVVIKVPNPDRLLRSGMTARIRIGEAPSVPSGTVRIPLSALVTCAAPQGAGSNATPQLAVFVVQQGKAVRRIIRTDDILNSSILVTEGLRAGEAVVTAGASFLYDGAPVEVSPEAAGVR
jgi:RND family efflux transporter MFP subunit